MTAADVTAPRRDWILSGEWHKRTNHWICQLRGHRFQAIATHIFCDRCGRIRPFKRVETL